MILGKAVELTKGASAQNDMQVVPYIASRRVSCHVSKENNFNIVKLISWRTTLKS